MSAPRSVTASAVRPRLALSALSLALLPLCAEANQSLAVLGYGLTAGPVYNRSNVGSAAYNPANAMRLIGDDENVRLGIFEAGVRYEIGNTDDVSQLKKQIQADVDAAVVANSAARVQELAGRINSVYLPKLESGVHGNAQGQVSLLTPILWRTTETLPGIWSLSASLQAQAGGAFRGADMMASVKFTSSDANLNNKRVSVSLTGLTSQLTALESAATSGSAAAQNSALKDLQSLVSSADLTTLQSALTATASGESLGTTYAITSASAFDVKVAAVTQVSLGYATDVTRYTPELLRNLSSTAKVDAGLRLSAYQARLYRQFMAVVDADGNSNKIEFNSDRSYSQSASAIGLDAGVNWVEDNYQLGATIYNINGPSFDYPSPLKDPNTANQAAAQQLAASGKVNLQDRVRLKPHLVVEGSLHSADKRWLLQSSLAVNKTTDFVGDEQQYFTASVGYNAERFEQGWLDYVMPSVRLGYRHNLAGAKLSGMGLGLSWGVVNLDLYTSLQKVQADGTSVPRSAGGSLSIAEKF